MDRDQLIAGAIGGILGTDWWDKTKVKNAFQGIMSVAVGTFSAVYLSPLIAKQMNWHTPEQVVGIAFAIGTLGLRSVQIVNAIGEFFLKKINA